MNVNRLDVVEQIRSLEAQLDHLNEKRRALASIDVQIVHVRDQLLMFAEMLDSWPADRVDVDPPSASGDEDLPDTWPGTGEARKKSSQKLRAVRLPGDESATKK